MGKDSTTASFHRTTWEVLQLPNLGVVVGRPNNPFLTVIIRACYSFGASGTLVLMHSCENRGMDLVTLFS